MSLLPWIVLLLHSYQFTCAPADNSLINKGIARQREDLISSVNGMNATAIEGYMMVRAIAGNRDQLEYLRSYHSNRQQLLLAQWKTPKKVGDDATFFVFPSSYKAFAHNLIAAGVVPEVVMMDSKRVAPLEDTTTKGVGNFDQKYHTYEEIVSELKRLAYFYPNITELVECGTSFEGKTLHVMKISTNRSSLKPVSIFTCGAHGREWLGIAACLGTIRQIVFYHESNREISSMLHGMDLHFVPLLNPDGYTFSRTTRRMWRKSRATSGRTRCRGVDINRNFNYRWGGVGSSADPCDDTYEGATPFSSAEALALARYLYTHRRRIAIFVDVHTFGQMWMYPWGYSKHPSRHDSLHRKIMNEVTTAIERETGVSYQSGPSSHVLYKIAGDSVDWVYGFLGVVDSYGVELRPSLTQRTTQGFRMPPSEIHASAHELFVGIRTLIRSVLDSNNAMSSK